MKQRRISTPPPAPPASIPAPRGRRPPVVVLALLALSTLGPAGCGMADPAAPRAAAEAPLSSAYLPDLVLGPGLVSDEGVATRRIAPVRDTFIAIDTDGNGRLSTSEIARHLSARFARADRNGDGTLYLQELGLADAPASAQALPFDLDGDGRMSEAEQRTYINAVISRDNDGDGAASAVLWRDIDRQLVR